MTDTGDDAGPATPGAHGRGADKLPREIWVLVSASFLIAIGYGIIGPALPSYAASFDVGVTAASVVVSAFAFVRLVFAPASGRLVTRFGERPIYLWGVSIVAVGTLLCAVAANYWQLLLFRSASGIGSTMFTVSAIGLLIRISPTRLRGRASSLWGTSFLLGGIAGPVVGSGLVSFSLRAPFLVYGIALVLTTVFVWWQLRNSELVARPPEESAPSMTFGQALRHPSYRAALASNLATGWVVFGVRMSLLPLFVTAVLARDESFTGFALALFAAANAMVLLYAGGFADRRGRKIPALAGLALLAVGAVGLGVSDNPWVFLAAVLVAGVGAGALNPAQNAAVADVLGAKARGGSVLAGFQMAADVGAVVGPLVAGAVAERWSYTAAFGLTGVVVVLALGLWFGARETLPSSEEDAPPDGSGDGDAAAGSGAGTAEGGVTRVAGATRADVPRTDRRSPER